MEEKNLKIQNQSIGRLDISCATIKRLNDKGINEIGQLCKKTRTDLKMMNIEKDEISKIDIELQLLGFCLKSNL